MSPYGVFSSARMLNPCPFCGSNGGRDEHGWAATRGSSEVSRLAPFPAPPPIHTHAWQQGSCQHILDGGPFPGPCRQPVHAGAAAAHGPGRRPSAHLEKFETGRGAQDEGVGRGGSAVDVGQHGSDGTVALHCHLGHWVDQAHHVHLHDVLAGGHAPESEPAIGSGGVGVSPNARLQRQHHLAIVGVRDTICAPRRWLPGFSAWGSGRREQAGRACRAAAPGLPPSPRALNPPTPLPPSPGTPRPVRHPPGMTILPCTSAARVSAKHAKPTSTSSSCPPRCMALACRELLPRPSQQKARCRMQVALSQQNSSGTTVCAGEGCGYRRCDRGGAFEGDRNVIDLTRLGRSRSPSLAARPVLRTERSGTFVNAVGAL